MINPLPRWFGRRNREPSLLHPLWSAQSLLYLRWYGPRLPIQRVSPIHSKTAPTSPRMRLRRTRLVMTLLNDVRVQR